MVAISSKSTSFNWFFPLFMVFAQYNIIWGYSLGLFILLIYSVFYIVKDNSLRFHYWSIIFIVSCITSQLIIHRSFFGIYTFVIILFAFLSLNDKLDENELYKYFKIFGSVVILGMIYHSIQVYIFGIETAPIRILPLIYNPYEINWSGYSIRPTSFFSEPQAYASYLMPFLFLALKKKELFWASVITISVLLSTSSQGVIMMLILWSGYILFTVKNITSRIGIFTLVTFFGSLYIFSPIFKFSRDKIITTELEGNSRLSRGFEIFGQLDWSQKILGIGYGNVGEFVLKINNRFFWGIGNENIAALNYTSGFSGTLIQFGIIITILLLLLFYSLWRNRDKMDRLFLFMIFTSFFSQNLLLNSWFVYFFIFFLGVSKKRFNPLLA